MNPEKDLPLAVYVHSVRSKTQRQILTKYRLRGHKQAMERVKGHNIQKIVIIIIKTHGYD